LTKSHVPVPLAASLAATQNDVDQTDGRRLRSQDSRSRIISAMMQSVLQGQVSVSAEQVAARAGVGLRTVFRHFKDMDSLYAEMSRVVEAEIASQLREPLAGETWKDKLDHLIDRRARIFDTIAPYRRAGLAHRHRSDVLAKESLRIQQFLRGVLAQIVPTHVSEIPSVFEALDFLLSFESWNRLREHQGLGTDEAKAILKSYLQGLLGNLPD
jgi:AcrR family transcriptional regulator